MFQVIVVGDNQRPKRQHHSGVKSVWSTHRPLVDALVVVVNGCYRNNSDKVPQKNSDEYPNNDCHTVRLDKL